MSSDSTSSQPQGAPRLIPGSVIAGNRYRLIAHHGGHSGFQFWKARDIRLDRDVALTFVNPREDDADPSVGVRSTLDRSVQLARVNSPGLAKVLDVIRGKNGGIIVSEWTPGASLKDVAEGKPPVEGVSYALRSLADACSKSHGMGSELSIDSPSRIRINSDNQAVVAFPGTSSDASRQQDISGVGATIYALLDQSWPEDIHGDEADTFQLPATQRDNSGEVVSLDSLNPKVSSSLAVLASKTVDRTSIHSAATITTMLDHEQAARTELSMTAESITAADTEVEPVAATVAPVSPREPDERSRNTRSWGMLALLVGSLVVIAGLLIAWAIGGMENSRDDRPLAEKLNALQEDAQASQSSISVAQPASRAPLPPTPAGPVIALDVASIYQPDSSPGSRDNPAAAPLVLDNNPNTAWSTDMYRVQLGTQPPAFKPGIGVMLSVKDLIAPRQIAIDSPSTGTKVEIRAASSPNPATLEETTLIGSGLLTSGTTTIMLDNVDPAEFYLVWIPVLSEQASGRFGSQISEIRLTS